MLAGIAIAIAMQTSASQRVESVKFDAAAVTWALKPGANAIAGEAFLRTQGGDVKTCAGFNVYLIPDSPYARSQMNLLFGSEESGFLGLLRSNAQLAPPDPDFLRAQFKSICDAAGRFNFTGLPSGRYYIKAAVSWSALGRGWGGSYQAQAQGGEIMQRIDLIGDDTDSVILTY